MKCPNCGYEDGWNAEKLVMENGDEGSFFTFKCSPTESDLVAIRGNCYEKPRRSVCGCPSCMMMFMVK